MVTLHHHEKLAATVKSYCRGKDCRDTAHADGVRQVSTYYPHMWITLELIVDKQDVS